MKENKVIDGCKRCSRCDQMKSVECFGRSTKTKCGLRSECYECRNSHRLMNAQHFNQSNKLWYSKKKDVLNEKRRAPIYRQKAREYYAANSEKLSKLRGKYKTHEEILRNRKKYRDRINVRKILNYHVKSGNILKSTCCDDCNGNIKLEAHHEDYSKPLDVMWLCINCHKKRHRKNEQ